MKWTWSLAAVAAIISATGTAADDLATIKQRRIADMGEFSDASTIVQIPDWLQSQRSDGTWPDVDYTAGCPARRANWPIQQHWNRIIAFAAAWKGASPYAAQSWKDSQELLGAAGKALDWWFKNDFTNPNCIGDGGLKDCPCGTPGLWNTNWYGSSILIPQLASTACLLLDGADLTDSQKEGCVRVPKRAYDLRDGTYGTGGKMTGSNMVLVMQNSLSMGLYMNNATIVKDTLDRAFAVMVFQDGLMADGIHRDGTFLQHAGLLYNANYGKDLFNAFIQMGGEVRGTSFAVNQATQDAIAAQARGNEWMIFARQDTHREMFDYNAVGRFLSFPTDDLQANSDINFNTTKLGRAVADFTGSANLNDTVSRLLSNGTMKLVGNKGFWVSDYMVHRRNTFVLATKMISTRSANTEAGNGANPYAYHQGQGSMYTYVTGTEYINVTAAWDWNLVPGTTALLNVPNVKTAATKQFGLSPFVGVVSDGKAGIAAEEFTEPATKSMSFRKARFYFDDAIVVAMSNIASNSSDPTITVLENRNAVPGGIQLDGKTTSAGSKKKANSLYYGGNGYLAYDKPFDLTLFEGERTGNWSEISTSAAGEVTTKLFSAYHTHTGDSMTYAVFPAISKQSLAREAHAPTYKSIMENGITAVAGKNKLGVVFWPGGDGAITVDLKDIGWDNKGTVTLRSSQPAAYLLSASCKGVRVAINAADPTQKLKTVDFSMAAEGRKIKDVSGHGGDQDSVQWTIELPTGGMAGSTVLKEAFIEAK